MVSSIAIVLVVFDDKNHSTSLLDATCQASPWIYCMGFAISHSALYAKINRAKALTLDKMDAKKSRHVKVQASSYLKWVFLEAAIEAVICTVWTTTDPLQWERKCASSDTDFCTSYGTCSSSDAIYYVATILSLHVLLLLHMLYVCYLSKSIPDEFSEHKWIIAICVSSIEFHIVAPLLIAVTWEDPTTSTLITVVALFAVDFGLLTMVFVPKILMRHRRITEDDETRETILFGLRKQARKDNRVEAAKDDKMEARQKKGIGMGRVNRNEPIARNKLCRSLEAAPGSTGSDLTTIDERKLPRSCDSTNPKKIEIGNVKLERGSVRNDCSLTPSEAIERKGSQKKFLPRRGSNSHQ
uniref:G-protein coupled receptors family 3 profile domain-containing protein n=1 Tax=Lotharella oceanica TaxID=641309 RepID=A0A7S2TWA0_9EUKA|mmetsp:Transcript_2993/g.5817  ORF Transcript_2993/g.5817 Transcript_2993/m.5817 type:complete len:355 (+) Transcript_2993:3-1067(+)